MHWAGYSRNLFWRKFSLAAGYVADGTFAVRTSVGMTGRVGMLQGFQPDSLLRILSAFLAFAGVTKLGPVRIRSFWAIEPYFR